MRVPRPPSHRRSAEASLLPMINVVFLLLIFFLIAAKLTPPEAFSVTPPRINGTDGATPEGRFTLLLGADGALAHGTLTGDAALPALAAARDDWCAVADCALAPPTLTIRADANAPASALAPLMRQLAPLGFSRVDLAAVQK